MSTTQRTRILTTADGTNTGAFDRGDWALTLILVSIWGSTFLWVSVGLRTATPFTVAFLRMALGAAALAVLPAARRPIPRRHWPTLAIVGVCGNGGPAALFAFAQQRVESSLAGMINATTPLMALLVGIALTRKSPGRSQVVGLSIGFAGVATIAAPNVTGVGSQPAAVGLLLLATACYGLSNNVMVPVAQQFGGAAVIVRAQLFGAVLLAPVGLHGLATKPPSWASLGAIAIVGVIGTGVARALSAQLVARTGASRGLITTYLVPAVATGLGFVVLGDSITFLEVVGTCLTLVGARLTARAQR